MGHRLQLHIGGACGTPKGIAALLRSTHGTPRDTAVTAPGRAVDARRDEIEACASRVLRSSGFSDVAPARAEPHTSRSRGDPVRTARAHAWPPAGVRLAAALHACVGWMRRLRAEWRRRQLVRATYRALHQLDNRTLHDLGLDRSELLSAATEVTTRAEAGRAAPEWALRGWC